MDPKEEQGEEPQASLPTGYRFRGARFEGLQDYLKVTAELLARNFLDLPKNEDFGDLHLQRLDAGPLRAVVRLVSASDSIVVKLFRPKGLTEALRASWLRSRALKEAALLTVAHKRGLPVPLPAGTLIEKAAFPSKAALFLQDLGDGQTLDALVAGDQSSEAHELLRRASEIVILAAKAGLEHKDLHLGNFFLTQSGSLYLLDLHKARIRAAAVTLSTKALQPLYLSLPWPNQHDLRRTLFRPLQLPSSPSFLPKLLRRHLRSRLARCWRSSGVFRSQEHGFLRRGFEDLCKTAAAALEAGQGAELKTGRRGRILRITVGQRSGEQRSGGQRSGEQRSVVAKSRRLKRAKELWEAAFALELRKIPVAQSLAFHDFGSELGSWVFSKDLSELPDLPQIKAPSLAKLLRIARSLGSSMGTLHATGWRCRDARGDNFKIAEDDTVVFVDLDGVRPTILVRGGHEMPSDLGRLLAWLLHQAPEPFQEHRAVLVRCFLRSYLTEKKRFGKPERSARSLTKAALLRSKRWEADHRKNQSGN